MIDAYRYCPICASPLKPDDRLYHRQCPACGQNLYENVAAAAGIILINDRDEALLTRRGREPHKGAFGITGGFVEPGESAIECAIRETKEESGLTDFEVLNLLGTFPDRYGHDTYTLSVIFVGRLRSGEPQPHDDVAALEWHSIPDLPDEALHTGMPNTQKAFAALQHWHRNRRQA